MLVKASCADIASLLMSARCVWLAPACTLPLHVAGFFFIIINKVFVPYFPGFFLSLNFLFVCCLNFFGLIYVFAPFCFLVSFLSFFLLSFSHYFICQFCVVPRLPHVCVNLCETGWLAILQGQACCTYLRSNMCVHFKLMTSSNCTP